MRTVIYARKSSESEDRQVQSLCDQERALTAMAQREGIQVDEVISESRSAKEPGTRPEFLQLLEQIKSGEVKRVLTWSMNRLSRNLVDGGQIAYLLQTGKLEWIKTIDRTYLPDDNALLLSIENGMATSFIQDLRKNVKRGMESKAAKGHYPGRAPLGYLNNPLTGHIDPDPERFHLVRKAWDLILSGGYTVMEAYHAMVKLGLTSKTRKRGAIPLTRSMFYNIFSNPFYRGTVTYSKREYEGKHLAMVTPYEFNEVHRLLNAKTDRRKRKHDYRYAGVITCGNCGCSVVASTRVKHYKATNRTVRYCYYHCTNGKGNCSKVSIPEDILHDTFTENMKKIKLAPPFVEWALEECAKQAAKEIGTLEGSHKELHSQLTRAESRLERLHEMRLDGELDTSSYNELKSKLTAEISGLKHAERSAELEHQEVTELVAKRLDLARRANDFDTRLLEEQRAMASSMGEKHFLTLGKLEIGLFKSITEITTFGPLTFGSGSPKAGDLLPSNSIWQRRIKRIRTLVKEEIQELKVCASAQK